jgi:AAA+ ATPase superfamily predicted ATPase
MAKERVDYRKDVAFINRGKELSYLEEYINERPEAMLFLHGPKSSGKTTLLYRFIDKLEREQQVEVKFLNLRKILVANYRDFLQVFFGIDYSRARGDIKERREYDLKFFKLSVEVLKGMESGELDPFVVMEKELMKLNQKDTKPILIIDELQALDKIYLNNGKDRQLIIELFNFFVAMTKESHLAHVIIASSDGYFMNTVYNDSRLKKTSKFFKVDYLSQEDVMEWLLNLEKYSRIKDYTLSKEEARQIWNLVGGSMWEIQDILSECFNDSLENVLNQYKKKIKGVISYYIGAGVTKEKALRLFLSKDVATIKDFTAIGISPDEIEALLRDMVGNNILYFDPQEAIYYPQGPSYRQGIKLYFENS